MEAGDLHDPGHLLQPKHGDDAESFTPQRAADEMREAVQRLRHQLHAGPAPLPAAARDPAEIRPDLDGLPPARPDA